MSRNGRHLFTSESVTEGHPDKIADQISDSILDAILTQDPASRVACETLVTTGLAGGAGDQGMMFGFACTETEELMPMPIMLAHKLVKGLSELRRDGTLDYLRPDGKSQVTVDYEGTRPVRVDAVVVSSQHSPEVSQETMREDVIEKIVKPVIPA